MVSVCKYHIISHNKLGCFNVLKYVCSLVEESSFPLNLLGRNLRRVTLYSSLAVCDIGG